MHPAIRQCFYLLSAVLFTSLAFAGPNGKIIYAFNGSIGANPYGPVIFDSHGNLFGIAGESSVYELSPSGSEWIGTNIYDLPETGYTLTMDTAGNIYGTLIFDGPQKCGSIFELSPDGSGGWTEINLHTLTPSEGCNPYAVTYDPVSGNLYGAAPNNGVNSDGTAFELTPSGGSWNFNIIYYFQGGSDGGVPNPILNTDALGNIYGTAVRGGAYALGNVFKLSQNSTGWTETTIYNFTGGYNGAQPYSSVVFDQAGNLYGTTSIGADNVGNVYKLRPTKGYWAIEVIHTFTGGPDGAYPEPFNLAIDKAGNVYGVAGGGVYNQGVIYEISPHVGAKWTFAQLHEFTGGSDGRYPSGLIFDSLGNLYGTASQGGPHGLGEVFMGTP